MDGARWAARGTRSKLHMYAYANRIHLGHALYKTPMRHHMVESRFRSGTGTICVARFCSARMPLTTVDILSYARGKQNSPRQPRAKFPPDQDHEGRGADGRGLYYSPIPRSPC